MTERRPPTLAETQARFHRLVTAPESVAKTLAREGLGALEIDAWIRGDPELTATERLDVYANMYFFRLLEVLRVDYPRLLANVGDDAFHDLVTDYLAAHPPTRPSVRDAGEHLPAFLRTHALATERPWLAELALLERARTEVFDARDDLLLDVATVRGLPPDRVASLELRLVAAHRVLELTSDAGRAWRDPDTSRAPLAADAPERRPWIVWRGREVTVVHHRPLDPDERRLFSDLQCGVRFDHLCEALAVGRTDAEAVTAAAGLLGRWLAQGLIARG